MQEQELQAAIIEYKAQLAALDEVLSAGADEDGAELAALRLQLEEALREAQEAHVLFDTSLQGLTGAEVSAAAVECTSSGVAASAAAPGHAAASTAPERAAQRPRVAGSNPKTHPSNRYGEQEPDFAALAAHYQDLAPHVRVGPGACETLRRAALFLS